ncbi:MAG: hypothetical protein JW820_08255 [Spirochaetales bacterium]|nr:hypothetical protein [Spirochaetales bacterium]
MNRSLRHLSEFTVFGPNAKIGRVDRFYADLDRWAVRYIAVPCPGESRHLYLISPLSLAGIDWQERRIRARTTRLEVERGPQVGAGDPVSRVQEAEHNRHFRLPRCWGGVGLWGDQLLPFLLARSPGASRIGTPPAEVVRLVSTTTLLRSSLHSPEGPLGPVADMLMDQETWAIRFLVVDSEGRWPPDKLMVDPAWIEFHDPARNLLYVALPRAAIREATEIQEAKPWEY